MVLKKIIFQNRYVALETPSRPPPFMANAILNFHFDYLTPSLMVTTVWTLSCFPHLFSIPFIKSALLYAAAGGVSPPTSERGGKVVSDFCFGHWKCPFGKYGKVTFWVEKVAFPHSHIQHLRRPKRKCETTIFSEYKKYLPGLYIALTLEIHLRNIKKFIFVLLDPSF